MFLVVCSFECEGLFVGDCVGLFAKVFLVICVGMIVCVCARACLFVFMF